MAADDDPKPAANASRPDEPDAQAGEAAQAPDAPSRVPDAAAAATSTATAVAKPTPASRGDGADKPGLPPKQSSAPSASTAQPVAENVAPSSEAPVGQREVLIVLMGTTGTGKSSFIKLVTGQDVKVGHGINSCTRDIEAVTTNIEGTTVTFIDTPGFNDTFRDDGEILTVTSSWMKYLYDRKELFSGIIYLQRITDNRFDGTGRRTLETLKKICGEDNYKKVALVTTCWDIQVKINEEEGRLREEAYKKEDYCWAHLLARDAQSYRHYGSKKTAMDIVKKLLEQEPAALDIQTQLSSTGVVAETDPGKFIIKHLQDEIKEIDDRIKENPQNENQDNKKLENKPNKTVAAETGLSKWKHVLNEQIADLQKPLEQVIKDAKAEATEEETDGKADSIAETGASVAADGAAAGKEASKTAEGGDAAKTIQMALPVREAKLEDGPPTKVKTLGQKIRDMLDWMEQRGKPK